MPGGRPHWPGAPSLIPGLAEGRHQELAKTWETGLVSCSIAQL
jgi:hypothetical protein